MVVMLVTNSSCVSEKGRKGRPLIAKVGSFGGDAPVETCSQFYDATSDECRSACKNGTHEADDDEIQSLIKEIETSDADPNLIERVLSKIQSAPAVCVSGSGVLRPTNAIQVNPGSCICVNGKPDVVTDCASFCTGKTDQTATLYGSVTPGPEVELNSELGNLENWCNNTITGSDFTAPACFLEVYDGDGFDYLPMTISSESNSFKANVSSLDYNKVYVAAIVENQSGSNARTSSFNIYRKKFDDGGDPPNTPLKIMPVSMYTCLTRSTSTVDGSTFFLEWFRVHYLFASNANPPSLPPGTMSTVCHDTTSFGNNDSPLTPRLELIPQHFAVWDESDPRFVDSDGDGRADINAQIEKLLLERANISRTLNSFVPLAWQNMPSISGFNESQTNPNLGFFMQPWIDAVSGKAFCPTQENYNGNDPIFNIMKEIVGVDTEALYLAESEPKDKGDGSFIKDVMMIRENILQKVWFYYENNQHFVPDDITKTSKTIMFYWPIDMNNPYVKKSDSIIYTIRHPLDIGSNVTSGLSSFTKPNDKRFGCIPAVD